MSVKGDKVECAINGTVVASYPKAELVAAGKLKSTDGVYGIRFATQHGRGGDGSDGHEAVSQPLASKVRGARRHAAIRRVAPVSRSPP